MEPVECAHVTGIAVAPLALSPRVLWHRAKLGSGLWRRAAGSLGTEG